MISLGDDIIETFEFSRPVNRDGMHLLVTLKSGYVLILFIPGPAIRSDKKKDKTHVIEYINLKDVHREIVGVLDKLQIGK